MNRDEMIEKIAELKRKYKESENKYGYKDSSIRAELSELRRQLFNTFE